MSPWFNSSVKRPTCQKSETWRPCNLWHIQSSVGQTSTSLWTWGSWRSCSKGKGNNHLCWLALELQSLLQEEENLSYSVCFLWQCTIPAAKAKETITHVDLHWNCSLCFRKKRICHITVCSYYNVQYLQQRQQKQVLLLISLELQSLLQEEENLSYNSFFLLQSTRQNHEGETILQTKTAPEETS